MKRGEETGSARRYGAAAELVDRLRQRGRVGFAITELERSTGLSPIAARRQLARLGDQVVRVAPKQEFFLVVDPEHRAFGAPPPAWWIESYFRWLGRPYYLALQSAAEHHGAAAQAIQVTQVMTNRPRREIRLGRVRVHFFVKRAIAATPTHPLAQSHAPLRVSTPAATVIDLVQYATRVGGLGRVVETIQPLVARLERADLSAALDQPLETPTLQRFGYLLERLGQPRLAKQVHARLRQPIRLAALDLSLPAGDDPTDARWSLRVNTEVEVPT